MIRKFRSPQNEAAGEAWPDPVPNPSASEFEVDLWTPTVSLGEGRAGRMDEPMMARAACRIKPSVVFDWGTHIGASARTFYECNKAFKLGYQIHSIDRPPDASHVLQPGQEHGRLVRGLDRVHLHRGNGVEVALEQWRKLGCPKRPLFFVDGDHAYESVRDELTQIFSTVPDASVLAHDTFFRSEESNYNVEPAIDEIVEKSPRRFRAVKSGLGVPGMTLLAGI
jgi:hypothetical protein